MTIEDFELGYTPQNLRLIVAFLQSTGMTLKGITESIGAGRYTTLANWMAEPEQDRHRNMPVDKWQKIVELFNSKNVN